MFLFLLKASLVVAILLAFYKLFLEKESFFAVNRIYLLACIILAVALPFLSLPKLMENQGYLTQLLQEKETEAIADFIPTDTSVDFEKSEPIDVESNENERKRENENLTPTTAEVEMEAQITFDEETTEVLVETSENQSFGLSDWLFWIYLFGVGVLFLNLLAQMGTTLFKAIRNDDKIADEEGTIINLEEESEPCSFFKYIFIHPDSYDFETYEQIVAHEKIHVKQWHSIDLLLAEIAVALFWFNPFVWLFRKEVEKNIEYQTDDLLTRKVVKKEKKGYQLNLLKIATHNKPLTITTNYNQSLIKQRILKMNAKKSNPYSYWKYAFVAPVLLTLILAMNEPYTAASFEPNELGHTVSYEEKTAVEAEEGDDMEKLHKIVEALRQRLKADKIVAVDDIVFQYKKGAITVNEQKLSKQQAARYLQFLKDNGVTIVGDKFQLHILPEKEHWRVSGKIEFNDPDREDNFNALMQAIKNDDLKAVKKYLARDVDLNRRDENGFTPLLLAAYEKHDLVAKAIVTHTAQQVNFEVNTSQARQWTASDLSTVDHKDFELFMRAIDDGDKELVTYFLDKGDIDVNGIGRHEFTPLMLAASEDHPEIVRLLIDRGARINFMNSNGWTALIEAADEGSYASAIVLIEAGADIDLHEKEGGRSAVVMSASEGHLNLLELLLESGADFSNYHDGYTPLHGAAEEGQTEIVKILLKKIDANFTDHYQRTPLFYAAEEGHVDIVKYLVAEGAKVNIQARNGRTPLSYAAEERQQAIVQFLLEKGADVSVRDEEGFTALDYAIDEAAEEVVNTLLKTDAGATIIQANNSTLLEAIEEGSLSTIRSLLEAGADVNGANRNGWTPLIEAADESNLEIAQFLVAKGAKVNAASNIGWTALIEAVDEKSLNMVRYLIEVGANVNAATNREFREGVGGSKHYIVHAGWTPLFEAIDEGAVLAADLLFKQGADVNASISRTLVDQENGMRTRYDNWTLLMDAVERERMEMIQFLLKSGADIKAKNSLGETALDVAEKTGNQLVVKMVRKG